MKIPCYIYSIIWLILGILFWAISKKIELFLLCTIVSQIYSVTGVIIKKLDELKEDKND